MKYSFPEHLHISRECLDMMSKLLVGRPANRISIEGVKCHPWFAKKLPDELKVSSNPTFVLYRSQLHSIPVTKRF